MNVRGRPTLRLSLSLSLCVKHQPKLKSKSEIAQMTPEETNQVLCLLNEDLMPELQEIDTLVTIHRSKIRDCESLRITVTNLVAISP